MQEVAARAGVAMSSVSRVLSGHPDVSDAMRERVMSAVDDLSYEPDWLAQSLRRQETRTIGFVMGDISNPLMASIALGAERLLREQGYSLVVTNSEGNPQRDAEHVQLLGYRRVDGLLLATANERHRPTIDALRKVGIPRVVIDRELPKSLGASATFFDHRTGMREAGAHLLNFGHRHVALILGHEVRPSRERLAGLTEAYEAAGLEPTFSVFGGTYSEEHGQAATREALSATRPPTAIIAASNQLVTGALRELAQRGLKVGTDVSLIACDEISLTELHDPPIAVVKRDNLEAGRRSAELLLGLLANDGKPSIVTLPTWFVPRPSVSPAP